MKYFKIAGILLFLLGIEFCGFGQQEPLFSQYMFNTFLINPAAAGSEGFTSFNLTGREQWLGIPGSPKTHSISVQTRVLKNSFIAKALNLRKKFSHRSKSGRVGVGAQIYNDLNGPISKTGMKLTYAYHIPLRQSQLSFGLSLLTYQFNLNKKDVQLYDQTNDNYFNSNNFNHFIIDGSFGAQFTTPFLYSGISVSDLFQSSLYLGKNSQLQVGRHYYLMGGYKFELNRFFMIEPSTLMKFSEIGAFQIDISTRLYYREDYWFGMSYRNGASGGAIIFLAGVRVNKYYFGYAFDLTLAPIMKHTFGSHEFMVSVKFGENARRYRWLNRY
jgi:type IX secretion system PorP/SprF family membrane protein